MRNENKSMHSGKNHAARYDEHMKENELHMGHMRKASHHKVETHRDGHKFEHHMENGMHRGHHENAYGYRDRNYNEMHAEGGMPKEEIYVGVGGGSMRDRRGMGELERERKMEGGGRMARQHKQREGLGMRDDTVYGRIPPVPGTIDS